MGKPLIMVSSITYAMKGKQILAQKGIRSDIVRTPSKGLRGSCGYSLFVPKMTDEAHKILEANGIMVVGRADKESAP